MGKIAASSAIYLSSFRVVTPHPANTHDVTSDRIHNRHSDNPHSVCPATFLLKRGRVTRVCCHVLPRFSPSRFAQKALTTLLSLSHVQADIPSVLHTIFNYIILPLAYKCNLLLSSCAGIVLLLFSLSLYLNELFPLSRISIHFKQCGLYLLYLAPLQITNQPRKLNLFSFYVTSGKEKIPPFVWLQTSRCNWLKCSLYVACVLI